MLIIVKLFKVFLKAKAKMAYMMQSVTLVNLFFLNWVDSAVIFPLPLINGFRCPFFPALRKAKSKTTYNSGLPNISNACFTSLDLVTLVSLFVTRQVSLCIMRIHFLYCTLWRENNFGPFLVAQQYLIFFYIFL